MKMTALTKAERKLRSEVEQIGLVGKERPIRQCLDGRESWRDFAAPNSEGGVGGCECAWGAANVLPVIRERAAQTPLRIGVG
jgi:hypothetical protein